MEFLKDDNNTNSDLIREGYQGLLQKVHCNYSGTAGVIIIHI